MKLIHFISLLLTIILCVNIKILSQNSVQKIELNSGWFFKQADLETWNKAWVPGCVHTDLMNNNIIDDPFFGTNEKELQWVGEKNWEYQTTFDIDEKILNRKNIRLYFKGLDTYAEVYLNGTKILSADNMFREWKVDCKYLLKTKWNVLQIHFKNVFDENLPKWEKAPYRLLAFPNNDQADTMIAMYSRKAQYHYGWDWGPRLITCGIWRPVIIEAWDEVKIKSTQVVQKEVSKEMANIICNLEIRSDDDQNSEVNLKIDGKESVTKAVSLKKGLNKIRFDLQIDKPNLWWTNGLGTQYLYDFSFRVKSDNGSIDSKSEKIGIRSLEIVRDKDSAGTSLFVKLNGVPVFMKGANYIPQDNFQNRVTHEQYEYMIKSAVDANMNMLRVWGGGIYQDDVFYEMCDKYGILIWHDMMFACAMYPSDENFFESVREELKDNVSRMRNHCSIALYCGNNENQAGWYQWGWKPSYNEQVQQQYEQSMLCLYENLIPNAIAEVDPTRYYQASSPIAGWGNYGYADGDIHYWGVWHGKEPFEKYNDNIARFVSEYGFQSYPKMSTIEKFTQPSDRELHSEVMLSHQRCMADDRRDKEYGNRLIKTYMDEMYNEPKDFESYIYVSQLVQAEGMKIAVEAHRRNMPFCMGSLYWQIDDCWPVASWSSIDYYGNWKALHYFAKKAYEQVHIAPRIEDDEIKFYITSDFLEAVNLEMSIYLCDFSGNQLYRKIDRIDIKANSSGVYFSIRKNDLLKGCDDNKVMLLAELRSEDRLMSQNYFYFVPQKKLILEKPEIKFNTTQTEDGYKIELSTDKLAKNVYLILKDAEGFFSDNFFDLVPGEFKAVDLKTKSKIENLAGKIKIISLVDSY
ncbi:MAG: glycoside hydrolase family 2 protein [bacterium]